MNTITLSKIIEAILLSSGRPLSEKEITNLFDEEEKPSHSEFKDALDLIEQNSKNNSFTLSKNPLERGLVVDCSSSESFFNSSFCSAESFCGVST